MLKHFPINESGPLCDIQAIKSSKVRSVWLNLFWSVSLESAYITVPLLLFYDREVRRELTTTSWPNKSLINTEKSSSPLSRCDVAWLGFSDMWHGKLVINVPQYLIYQQLYGNFRSCGSDFLPIRQSSHINNGVVHFFCFRTCKKSPCTKKKKKGVKSRFSTLSPKFKGDS